MADLNLKFENGKAPALNADNMNKIVNAINENDNKSKELTDEILATNNKINEIMAEKIPEEVISAEVNAYIQEHNSNLAFSKDVANNWNGNGYNLIPFPYYDGMSKSINNVNITVNNDGTVIFNGTDDPSKAGSTTFELARGIILKKNKAYRISGCTSNLSGIGRIYLLNASTSTVYQSTDNVNGKVFTPTDDITVNILCQLLDGKTMNNELFKPMLVEVNADGTYPTEYQRYASGNVELTDNKASTVIISEKFDVTKSYVEGDYLIYNDTLYKVKVNCSGIVPPNTTYYEAVTVASEVTQLKTSLKWYKVGEASGNATIPLPSDWQELKVVTYHQSSKRTFDTTILKLFADIDNNTKYFYDGDFETNSSSNGCGWTCSATHINCFLLYLNGSSDLANSKTYLYAR